MKKSFLVFGLALLVSSPIFGLEFGIKISGGPGYFNLKDINRSLNGWVEVLKTRAQTTPGWSWVGGGIKRFQSGAELEAEIVFSLNRRLAFGLGAGFLYGEVGEKNAQLSIQRGASTFVYAHPAKVSAFPIVLSAYYFFPLRQKLSLFLRAGGGVVSAKYVDRDGYKIIPATYFAYGNSAQIASGRGALFEFGLGTKFDLEKMVDFFFEASGRACRPKHFEGALPDGTNGKLYFYEELDPILNIWQAKMRLLAAAPSGETVRAAREAMVDFNGFSLKIGMVIHF